MLKFNTIHQSVKNSNVLHCLLKNRCFNSNEFKLDKKSCLDYLNHSFSQFQTAIYRPSISKTVLLQIWKTKLSTDQINKTNDLLKRINNDEIYRQAHGYLLNNLDSLNNHEFTNIYKIFGNIELMEDEANGNGVKLVSSKMRRKLREDFMKRVKQFDINNLFDFDLGYAIGDDKQMLEQIRQAIHS